MQKYRGKPKDELDDKDDSLATKRISDKSEEKYGQMNIRTETKNKKGSKEALYTNIQCKGTCTTCGKHGHKAHDFWHKEVSNKKTSHCCNKPGHIKKDCWKKIWDENLEPAKTQEKSEINVDNAI